MIEIYIWAVLIWNAVGALGTALSLLDNPARDTLGIFALVVNLGFVASSGLLIMLIRAAAP